MFDDELDRKVTAREFPAKLDAMSVSELAEYIDDLKSEITRVETEMAKKKAAANAADAFFK